MKIFEVRNSLIKKSGFTVVELLVTISLIIIFTTAAASYNRTADKQLSLYREQGRLISSIHNTKTLALETFSRDESAGVPCGYGIHIPDDATSTVIIFKDLPNLDGDCKVYSESFSGELYNGDEENFETVDFKDVSLKSNFKSVLFVPPDPKLYVNSHESGFPATIKIYSSLIKLDLNVSINKFGQISTQ